MADDSISREFNQRIGGGKGDAVKLIPAATVVLLRDGDAGLETLMLRKNSKIAFGGMWVFPGGRIDDEDGPGLDMEERARIAAAREAMEEASVRLDASELVPLSHWTPPPVEIKRFSTWFFAARAPEGDHTIDDGEITDSRWISPDQALAQHAAREIELVPPTFVTLHTLCRFADVGSGLEGIAAAETRQYVTQVARSDEGMVVMWEGDAGYAAKDASLPGPRHRLVMGAKGFEFDDSGLR